MAYDSTLLETMPQTPPVEQELPECIRRDRLNAGYFAQMTIAQLATVIVLSLIFLWTSLHRLNTEVWGHLNLGRWIVQHQSLPAVDPFTATHAPVTFIPEAWLAQTLSFWTSEFCGFEGLVLAHAALVTLACGLMMGAIRARGVSLGWAVAGGAACYLLSLPAVGTLRPELFGMVGMSLALLACAQLTTRRLPLVWLPIAFILWANLDRSYLVGLAMLFVYAAGVTCDLVRESRNFWSACTNLRSVRLWSAVGLATLGASVSPAGFGLFTDVAAFGQSSWIALSLASFSGVLFYGSAIVAVLSLHSSQRRWEWADLLLLIVFGLATVSAARMLPWWAAIGPWALLPYVASIWNKRAEHEVSVAQPPQAMRTLIAVGFVFMALLMSPPTNNLLSGRPRGIGAVTSKGTPIYVADEIARRQLQGNFFAPTHWSDYLVWKQPEGLRPVAWAQGRSQHADFRRDYQQIAAGAPEWLKLADSHQLRYLVISKQGNKTLAQIAMKYAGQSQSRATVLYQDQDSVLLELRPQS